VEVPLGVDRRTFFHAQRRDRRDRRDHGHPDLRAGAKSPSHRSARRRSPRTWTSSRKQKVRC
jgi:hypothetical protein